MQVRWSPKGGYQATVDVLLYQWHRGVGPPGGLQYPVTASATPKRPAAPLGLGALLSRVLLGGPWPGGGGMLVSDGSSLISLIHPEYVAVAQSRPTGAVPGSGWLGLSRGHHFLSGGPVGGLHPASAAGCDFNMCIFLLSCLDTVTQAPGIYLSLFSFSMGEREREKHQLAVPLLEAFMGRVLYMP